jgi:AcrR family transcriptional regulator
MGRPSDRDPRPDVAVPTAAPRTMRRDAVENRQRLIRAASDVFGEHGTEVPLELVGAQAGIGMATLYRRFATKIDLIAELVHAMLRYFVDVAAEQADTDDGLGLERWLADYADVQSRKRGLVAHIWAEDAATATLRTQLQDLLGALLREAQAAGRIRPDAAPTDVLLVIHALRGIAQSTAYDEAGAWRRHVGLVLAGLRATAVPLDAPPWTPRDR